MQLVKAAICQILALFAIVLLARWLPAGAVDSRFYVLSQAVIAASLSSLVRQPVWWRIIHLSFIPAAAALQAFNLSPWLYLLILTLLALIFWGTVKGDVPLFLSSSEVNDALIEILKQEKASNFAELGAGIGTVVAPLACRLPDLRVDTLERAPLPYLLTYWRCRKFPNVRLSYGSFWEHGLAGYDVVFGFLSPVVMAEIGEKARREMRQGSLFISSAFPVPGWLPEAVVRIDGRRPSCLYCYRIQSA